LRFFTRKGRQNEPQDTSLHVYESRKRHH